MKQKDKSEGVTAQYTKHSVVCLKILILLQQPGYAFKL
jgi:hypothetical protein